MKHRKTILAGVLTGLMLLLAACGDNGSDNCNHHYGDWMIQKAATCTQAGTQTRSCKDCGESETQTLAALGHTEAATPAHAATCTETGLTEGKHCGLCHIVLVKQELVPALSHTEAIDAPKDATCTESGLTEGKHCSLCNTILVQQAAIPALGHSEVITPAQTATCTEPGLTQGKACSTCGLVLEAQTEVSATGHDYQKEVISSATCAQDGTERFTCSLCGDSYDQSTSLEEYDASEIYEMTGLSVGEIITYDRNGNEYAIGTGFVYKADGQIITNYHVIEDACAAKITINGETYEVEYVLGYDKTIDLAVLKIDGTFTPLPICYETHAVGKPVYAFGSSRGLTATFSQGIITYSQREVDGVMHVQHDAAISGGNSGGPLIDRFGHVIGINTWTIRDSQNLNFAIATTEINNLTLNQKLTLAELFEQESDIFTTLRDYIVANGDYGDGEYSLELGTDYGSDSSYTRMAYYSVEDEEVQFGLIYDEEYMVYFCMTEINGNYEWVYCDIDDNIMVGDMDATTFNSYTTLDYYDHNLPDSSMCEGVASLSSSMMELLVLCLDNDLIHLGITAYDLCFLNY